MRHNFAGYGIDGANPGAGLVQATDRNFYGTTTNGGDGDAGTVFKITPGGRLSTLYSFDWGSGDLPYSGLLQATDGAFYGTTGQGGTDCCGTVYRLSMGLGPFVRTAPGSGKVGAPVVILGTNLAGTTAVTFHGTAAAFTVVSSSEITTEVPGWRRHGQGQSKNTQRNALEQRGLPGATTDQAHQANQRPGGNAGADYRGQP